MISEPNAFKDRADAPSPILLKHLKHLRLLCGFSQEQLAHILGVTRQTVIALETGKRPMTKTMSLALLFVFSRDERASRAMTELGLLPGDKIGYA